MKQDFKTDQSEHRITMLRTGEALERLIKSKDWEVVDKYFAERQMALVNNLCTSSVGGDGLSMALASERDKGALQEIRRFVAVIAGTLSEYNKYRSERVPLEDEVPHTAPPPQTEAEAAAPEGQSAQVMEKEDVS